MRDSPLGNLPRDNHLLLRSYRPLALFLATCFGLTLTLNVSVWFSGGLEGVLSGVLVPLQMSIPALSALLCVVVLRLPFWQTVGLTAASFRNGGVLRILLSTLAGVFIVTFATVLATGLGVLTRSFAFDPTVSALRSQIEQAAPGMDLPPMWLIVGAVILVSMIAGISINSFFALGEEIGWRGYLYSVPFMKDWRARSAVVGIVWGLWHAPLIAMGYEYGENIPAVAGICLFTIFAVLLSFILGRLRIESNSIVPAVVAHGYMNAVATLPMLFARDGVNAHPELSSIVGVWGVAAILPFAAASIFVGAKGRRATQRADSVSDERALGNS